MNRLLLALLLPTALVACTSSPTPSASTSVDAQYMSAAAGGNQFEIQSSQLALSKSGSDAVKAFAQQMITDHTQAQSQLTTLATTKNVALPTALPPDLQLKISVLSSLSGTDFDNAYGQEQLLAHQLNLSVQQNELQTGQDAGVQAYASAQVPVVTMHLNMAKSLPGAVLPAQLPSR